MSGGEKHVVLKCRRFEVQREETMNKMKELGMQVLTFRGLLSVLSARSQLCNISFISLTQFFDFDLVRFRNDLHSGTVGGGNAPISWMPAAVKPKEEKESARSRTWQPTFRKL